MSLILVDGSALFYRAHYAFAKRPLTSPDGETTSVVFGFFNSLLRLIQQYEPTKMAVVFDVKGKNFRHEMYSKYKANRKPMPDELAEQLPRLRELLAAWGIAVLEKGGVEADDVIATIARRSEGVCDKVWLYSGDKDFMQLLDDRVSMLKPGKGGDAPIEFTADRVRKEYGLEPKDLIQVFALAGDQADNIPGAPGVGDKTARKLVSEFGNLEILYERLDKSKLTPRLKRVLGESREQVFLSRRLFTIVDDVDVELNWDSLTTVLPTGDEITSLLGELGLRRVIQLTSQVARQLPDRVAGVATGATTVAPSSDAEPGAPEKTALPAPEESWAEKCLARGYRSLDSPEKIARWLEELDPGATLAVDTETDDLRKDTARLVGISLAGYRRSGERFEPAYIPIRWRRPDEAGDAMGTLFPVGPIEDQLAVIRPLLAPVFSSAGNLKVGQNLKFDQWILGRHGLPLAGPFFDTMLAAYVLDPGLMSHGLDELVLSNLGHRMMPYKELFASNDRLKDILAVDCDKLALYAAEDADFTLRLYEILAGRLKQEGFLSLFQDLEMPVSTVLLAMERNGIMIDQDFLASLSSRFESELEGLEHRIHELAGEPFNVQSPKQLGVILFDKLGLKPIKKTATGWSTDVSVLTVLAEEHELPALVLEYRQVAKLQNTYVVTLPKLANPVTGLIHTSYNQAVAATGRLSSSDPNLQNIPIRTELGRLIRQAFVPREEGNVFLSADYSQVELRLLAHLADDPGLLAAFQEGADVHRRTAALIAGVAEETVTSDMRSRAKAINFGVIYGMGARALARQIGVTVKEAASFIDTYFETYPGVRQFIERTKDQARRDGWVETLLGRRRLLPDIASGNPRIRSFQERVAVNTPIQGTAADMIKLAMLAVDRRLAAEGGEIRMLLQVHDELVFEVPRGVVGEVGEWVRREMEGAMELKIPLVVEIHAGDNWAQAHG
ncbi:MAG: DNA polymerase I [Gemmatimonadales bacterium]|nr:DNA polymerase I [Gemmatimonadales bacterium]